jgi:IS5 family transposase
MKKSWHAGQRTSCGNASVVRITTRRSSPCDATQIGRFRTAIGEAGVETLLKATIDTAVVTQAVRPAEFERIVVDTTVQEKAIAHPTDSRLLAIARTKIVQAARQTGIVLKQTLAKESRRRRRQAGGYAHAKQFKRLKRTVKRQRTILGIVLREIRRKPATACSPNLAAMDALNTLLERAERLHAQQPKDKALCPARPGGRIACAPTGDVRGANHFGVP